MSLKIMLLWLVLLDLPRGDGVHRNLLISTVYRQGSNEAINRPLAGGIHRVLVVTLVGSGQDDASFLAEMAVGLVSEEKLPAGVYVEGRVEFLPMRQRDSFLIAISLCKQVPGYRPLA
jgi:hypothetical protein